MLPRLLFRLHPGFGCENRSTRHLAICLHTRMSHQSEACHPCSCRTSSLKVSYQRSSSQLLCGERRPERTSLSINDFLSLRGITSKREIATRLVDHTTNVLCSIWLSHDIHASFPLSFSLTTSTSHTNIPPPTTTKATTESMHQAPVDSSSHKSRNHLLLPSAKRTALDTIHQDPSLTVSSQTGPGLMKKFVHETLRRSGSSTEVLYTALCYLEALRPKIPHLMKLAKEAQCAQGEIKLNSRIPRISSYIGTLEVAIAVDEGLTLPSPLICPRRAFLATIILASKFTQERSYSNRAWAKLSGLPVDEIGRCERALGNTLDWRLWVH